MRVVRTVAQLDAEAAAAVIASCGLTNEVRPEVLSAQDFARLVQALNVAPPTASGASSIE